PPLLSTCGHGFEYRRWRGAVNSTIDDERAGASAKCTFIGLCGPQCALLATGPGLHLGHVGAGALHSKVAGRLHIGDPLLLLAKLPLGAAALDVGPRILGVRGDEGIPDLHDLVEAPRGREAVINAQ